MKSAETSLLDFLKANPSWYASAQLQRMYWLNKNKTLASPRSIVRRLEENTPSLLEVKYIGGNAYYKIREEHKKKPILIVDETHPYRDASGQWRGRLVPA